jgi:hypothetical protein
VGELRVEAADQAGTGVFLIGSAQRKNGRPEAAVLL